MWLSPWAKDLFRPFRPGYEVYTANLVELAKTVHRWAGEFGHVTSTSLHPMLFLDFTPRTFRDGCGMAQNDSWPPFGETPGGQR
jgi:hypothetical protein